ncbi:MAG TPA: hypothetical protein DEF18_13700 [Muricauda sp.]|uniref:Uncharacterized protein n=1 Tax=Flagellimonas sediminis TaxID=2696468 RepID=A0A6I5KQA4_9FLAO|nr:hypothetical protein [Allomuricauda sediminis]MBC73055.1 hypothetical protein [Allomuricauda sp.]NDV42075.1 hypothetical protein [Allomuricauda sediminis]HBU79150.1 hypothetical protein [Allomuricauda sp.]|tara:strand:- start:1710 stop:1979 length:270 start_codon:yes stop_codon:yes gene_type:complete
MRVQSTYEKLSVFFTNTRIWKIEDLDAEFGFHLVCEDWNESHTGFPKYEKVKINSIDWKNRTLWVSMEKRQLKEIGEKAILELKRALEL